MQLREFLDMSPHGAMFELARKLKTNPANVSNWAAGRRKVPVHWCIQIEDATDGKVTRADLRPHDYFVIWPDFSPKS